MLQIPPKPQYECDSRTFQVIDALFQFGNCPLGKLCTGFSLGGIQTKHVKTN